MATMRSSVAKVTTSSTTNAGLNTGTSVAAGDDTMYDGAANDGRRCLQRRRRP